MKDGNCTLALSTSSLLFFPVVDWLHAEMNPLFQLTDELQLLFFRSILFLFISLAVAFVIPRVFCACLKPPTLVTVSLSFPSFTPLAVW